MNINIIGRKVVLRDNFKTLVEKKLSKFDRIFDEDAKVSVTVTLEKNHQVVEITIAQRGMVYRAEAVSHEMNEALDIAVSKLGKQIRKNKTKLLNSKKIKSIEYTDEYYEEPEENTEIVKKKNFYVAVMTTDEAILQMNLIGHSFFMFRNGDNGDINLVYKRNDGAYGLIEPIEKWYI